MPAGHDTSYSAPEREVEIIAVGPGTTLTTGDGKQVFIVPDSFAGLRLVDVDAAVTTVSSSGAVTVQIRNATAAVDMLSTAITIDQSEKNTSSAATPPVINAANARVSAFDEIFVDIDGAGTGAAGLIVVLAFAP